MMALKAESIISALYNKKEGAEIQKEQQYDQSNGQKNHLCACFLRNISLKNLQSSKQK